MPARGALPGEKMSPRHKRFVLWQFIDRFHEAASDRPKRSACALTGPDGSVGPQPAEAPKNTDDLVAFPLEERQNALPFKAGDSHKTLGISRSVLTLEDRIGAYTKEKLWKNVSAKTAFSSRRIAILANRFSMQFFIFSSSPYRGEVAPVPAAGISNAPKRKQTGSISEAQPEAPWSRKQPDSRRKQRPASSFCFRTKKISSCLGSPNSRGKSRCLHRAQRRATICGKLEPALPAAEYVVHRPCSPRSQENFAE
jgi:hypothetical protein